MIDIETRGESMNKYKNIVIIKKKSKYVIVIKFLCVTKEHCNKCALQLK